MFIVYCSCILKYKIRFFVLFVHCPSGSIVVTIYFKMKSLDDCRYKYISRHSLFIHELANICMKNIFSTLHSNWNIKQKWHFRVGNSFGDTMALDCRCTRLVITVTDTIHVTNEANNKQMKTPQNEQTFIKFKVVTAYYSLFILAGKWANFFSVFHSSIHSFNGCSLFTITFHFIF